jgi:hypothetical protein
MRIQCGGLMGLQLALNSQEEVNDIDGLLGSALQKFDELANLPYSQIVREANAHYKPRRS